MNHHPPRYYSSEQVSRIIRNALKIKEDEGISHRELMETGKELGLDESTLAAAIKAEERESVRYRSHQRRKTGFHWHLYSYLVVNLALFVVNALVPGPWWFQWSVLGWASAWRFILKRSTAPLLCETGHNLFGQTGDFSMTPAAEEIVGPGESIRERAIQRNLCLQSVR